MTELLDISRSQLGDFLRCRRKFQFRHLLDVSDETPVAGSIPMRAGTLGHYGFAAGYEALRQVQQTGTVIGKEATEQLFKTAATDAMAFLVKEGTYLYRDKVQQLRLDTEKEEHRKVIITVGDAVQYYADHFVYGDMNRYQILSTETRYEWTFVLEYSPNKWGCDPIQSVPIQLSGVFDLCAKDLTFPKDRNVLTVFDHKFTGDVNGSLAFLPLDVQMLVYEIVAYYYATQVMGYDDVEIVYNMVRREVPPGYGSRPTTTKSGAKSTASTRLEDYLRRTTLFHSERQRAEIESNFLRPALKELVEVTLNDGPFLVTPIRTGGESCEYGCDFFERCKATLVGSGQPRFGSTSTEVASNA